ncbi:hypothetical protein ACWDR2_28845 [Streptomyces sp. NPDC003631]|uniref:hypothetical protein n=1 Tax=unclassified Streptomyces TaxID=2593676 RepID=UPI0033BDCA29
MSVKHCGAYRVEGRIYLVDTEDYALVLDDQGEVIGEGCDFSSYVREYLGSGELD